MQAFASYIFIFWHYTHHVFVRLMSWHCSSLSGSCTCCLSTKHDWEWEDCPKSVGSGESAVFHMFSASPLSVLSMSLFGVRVIYGVISYKIAEWHITLYACGTFCTCSLIDNWVMKSFIYYEFLKVMNKSAYGELQSVFFFLLHFLLWV